MSASFAFSCLHRPRPNVNVTTFLQCKHIKTLLISDVTTGITNQPTINPEKVKILAKEPKDYSRKILEAIHIRQNNPSLNRDKGLELDPVWDRVLL